MSEYIKRTPHSSYSKEIVLGASFENWLKRSGGSTAIEETE